MSSENALPGDVRRAALAKLLTVLAPDQSIAFCTSGPVFESERLVLGMPFDDLCRLGKAREFLAPFEILFGAPYGQSVEDLLRTYGGRSGYEFNVILDDNNSVRAFTCGRLIEECSSGDPFLVARYAALGEICARIDDLKSAICGYVGDGAPVYFLESGGVLKEKRNDLRYLSTVCAPAFQAALGGAAGRLVCVVPLGAAMAKIMRMLGFDVIASAGPFAYFGAKDIRLALLAFQKLQPAILADMFRLLGRLGD